MKNNNVYDDIK